VNRIGFQHQQSNGYRDHSALERNALSWTGIFKPDEKRILKTTFLYGHLFYETPGALTLAEYKANPKMARPAVGGFPSAEQSEASITQKSFLGGASYAQQLSLKWQNTTSLYGMVTELRNPAIRNYGKSLEPHVGARTLFKFQQPFTYGSFGWDIGGEWQYGSPSVSIHKNMSGNPDSLQIYDEITNRQYFLFTQAVLDIAKFTVTAGASSNKLKVSLQRFQPQTLGKQTRNFDNEIAPRFSVSRSWKFLTAYTSVSKGFSPPTTAELTPSGSAINLGLNAEEGWNYDLGFKMSFQNGLYADVNAFVFSLENTIVTRRDAGGGDYFINAGKTKQHGVETYISYPLFQSAGFINKSLIWLSHTWHDFHYKTFKQLGNDFSGHQLPGIPPHTISTGLDLLTKNGLSGNIAYYFSDKIPLNDANTEYAAAYHLLSGKIAYEKWIVNQWRIKIVGGVENILNQTYSLGNDINGFGGRYYNAAPGRNYYASLIIQLSKLKS
jgi:iron complex outermembrane receptor protein